MSEFDRSQEPTLRTVLYWAIGVAIIGLIVGFVLNVGGLGIYKATAKRWQDAETDVFHSTQSHVGGTIRTLRRYKIDWQTANPAQKVAIRDSVMSEVSSIDPEKLPEDLRDFVDDVQQPVARR